MKNGTFSTSALPAPGTYARSAGHKFYLEPNTTRMMYWLMERGANSKRLRHLIHNSIYEGLKKMLVKSDELARLEMTSLQHAYLLIKGPQLPDKAIYLARESGARGKELRILVDSKET